VGGSTVYRTKRRFVLGNLEAALSEEPRPGADRKLSGKEEALLVATACSNPPEGRARWTLDLLADAMVRFTEHDDISRETVRRRLAENELKPWRKDMWCIPQVDGEFVARMEDGRGTGSRVPCRRPEEVSERLERESRNRPRTEDSGRWMASCSATKTRPSE
jgi:transposase